MYGLAFADFAFEDVDAERVENFFLDRAPERARAVIFRTAFELDSQSVLRRSQRLLHLLRESVDPHIRIYSGRVAHQREVRQGRFTEPIRAGLAFAGD
jgi:hypothetical protein